MKFENIYLIFGQEQYLCNEFVDNLVEGVLSPNYKNLNYEYMEGEHITAERIINSCETLPFMEDCRLVIIKDYNYLQGGESKGSEREAEDIANYLTNISPTTCLVFWQSKNVDKRKKLYKTINKYGKIIEFDRLKPYQLEKWLKNRIIRKGKTIKKSVLLLFIENTGYLLKNSLKTLMDIDNEVDKIINYIGNRKEITKEDIDSLITRSLENDIFRMVDAIGKKDKITALRLLNEMLKGGESPFMILNMIARQFRILIQCKKLREKGYSQDLIASKLSLAPFIVGKGLSQSNFFKEDILKQALEDISKVDLKIKTGKLEIKLALEMLVFEYTK
ncbi:MAG TPA: DNA polymerase III subunit delta [Eubacteriaceae bacterium]|jgi:DNA polymerase-3 subunit delta|nr:DNA polymerase III subunit delta [Eubacteriaceae bacterium]